ncbi:MAG: carbamoyltransferase family protein [Pseudomonadales bacterium]
MAENASAVTRILGLSAYYHDSAAALLIDGEIVAAAQEERFTRTKHDPDFPANAIRYCLAEANLDLSDIDQVVFYDKPFIKFERLLETYLTYAPKGFRSFAAAMPVWLKEKLLLKSTLKRELGQLLPAQSNELPTLLFAAHHQSHAASAYYPSPYSDAAVLCLDGVGEWATTSVWRGQGGNLTPLWEIQFPHSLGLLYSAFTYFTGFKVNSGEYKLMGLAPYGKPTYVDQITSKLIDVKPDGTFRLNMKYFNYCTGLTMTSSKFDELFDGPPRQPEAQLTQREMDIAASIQQVTEDIVLKLAATIHQETGAKNLCLAGGVALNCVANGRILRESAFDNVWIQPAAGDAGGALGCAQAVWYESHPDSKVQSGGDSMRGSYLGPRFGATEIESALQEAGAPYKKLEADSLYDAVAKLIDEGNVIGWFQGRMEFGPRALGGRSILGDPRNREMQTTLNLKIKYRESFRPFAPSVIADDVSDWFELESASPYMLIVAQVEPSIRTKAEELPGDLFGIEQLKQVRSALPAITHVDYSARVQTVHEQTNPAYYRLLQAFKKRTGCGVLVNTSFNVRGEPIVCTPQDAYRCFMRTEMDYLVLENYILDKRDQPEWEQDEDWRQEFALD